jgi:pimeloyl-ACP methyl ester carboxylesterase
MLPEPTTVLELPDGRLVACDDVGDPSGTPVLYLHGGPDCRLARHPDDSIAERLGVRLVAIDRPGYGWTDPQPEPNTRLWGEDVARLLDELGIERCRVAAWSAGGPWAFGVAAGRPDRIDRLITFGAVAAFEDLEDPAVVPASASRVGIIDALHDGIPLDEVIDEVAAMTLPAPPVTLDTARDAVLDLYGPRARLAVEAIPGLVDRLALSLAAAIDRHGSAGMRSDMTVQFLPGLPAVLADVQAPVTLVHGTDDKVSGPAAGRSLAARLADATVIEWPVGHQGVLLEWRRWLELVVA